MNRELQAPAEVEVPAALAVQLDTASSSRPEEIGAAMGAAFGRLMGYIGRHGLSPLAPPRAIYTMADRAETRFTVAIPVAGSARAPAEADVRVQELPACRALRFVHRGPYDQLGATYREITGWLGERGLIESEADWARFMPMWEEYVSDPEVTPPADLLTHIFLPLP